MNRRGTIGFDTLAIQNNPLLPIIRGFSDLMIFPDPWQPHQIINVIQPACGETTPGFDLITGHSCLAAEYVKIMGSYSRCMGSCRCFTSLTTAGALAADARRRAAAGGKGMFAWANLIASAAAQVTEHHRTYMGVSENSVPLNPMVLLIIIPFLNGYFIGSIPYSQTNPHDGWDLPISQKFDII